MILLIRLIKKCHCVMGSYPSLCVMYVVTVAQVDDEIRVDNSFVQIWKVKFDHHLSFCSDFEHKVSRFGQDFEVDVQAIF